MRALVLVAALIALVAVVLAPAPALAAGESPVIVLTADNFAQKTKSGTWIVEFYAPWCPHCKRFAPRYEKFAEKAIPWRHSYNFYVAKVDCVAHESLCDSHKVVGFPTIYAFVNGERKDEFEDEQTYKAIEQFGTAMVAKYPHPHAGTSQQHNRAGDTAAAADAAPAKPLKKQADTPAAAASAPLSEELKAKKTEFVKIMKERSIPDLGRFGRVVDLTSDNFEEITSHGGPWLLEFYAPWCGHCQALESTYSALAAKLKGKMNVARINADDQVDLRQRFGIRGYPTIKLYKSGATTDYRGARTLEALEEFALSSVQPTDVRHVTYAEFGRLRDEHEVAVVFAYGAKAAAKDWMAFLEAADSWMLPTVTGVYASVDPQFSAGNHAGEAVVLVYRRGYKDVPRYPTGQDAAAGADDEDEEEKKKKEANKIVYDEEAEAAKKAAADAVKFSAAGVRKFVHDHRFPLLPELTDHNAEDIMDGTADDDDEESDASQSRRRRVVVLGILDPKTTADDKERRVLTEVADKVLKETGGRMHGVAVQSVWLNGRVWEDYIQRVYQLSSGDLPRVIISVPAHEEFYAMGEDGKPIAFTTKAIYDAVEDVVKQKAGIAGHHAKLSPTSTRGRIVSWAKAGWRKVNTLSPGFLLGAVVVSVLGIWFMCCRQGSSGAAYDRLESSKFD